MFNRPLRAVIGLVLLTMPTVAIADTVVLNSGSQMEGVILQETASSITIRRGYGTMVIQRDVIKSIDRTPVVSAPPAEKEVKKGQRLPPVSNLIALLARQPWAKNIQQIPATVIDNGSMKYVPYMSYRCDDDYEINIYGDPDAPAGIEIGIYRKLLTTPGARDHCLDLIAGTLPVKEDADFVKTLKTTKDLQERGGLSFEITPADAPDAYGGWWISVYDEKLLDESRAKPEELAQICTPRSVVPPAASPATPNAASEPPVALASQTSMQKPAAVPGDAWSPDELKLARAPQAASDSGATPAPSSGGQVYVRGYTRKNGTYVSSYTRRR